MRTNVRRLRGTTPEYVGALVSCVGRRCPHDARKNEKRNHGFSRMGTDTSLLLDAPHELAFLKVFVHHLRGFTFSRRNKSVLHP